MATAFKFVKGQKVLPRGPHWRWSSSQYEGAVYGIMVSMKIDESNEDDWVRVEWINYKGEVIRTNSYRIGPNCYDLKIYEE